METLPHQHEPRERPATIRRSRFAAVLAASMFVAALSGGVAGFFASSLFGEREASVPVGTVKSGVSVEESSAAIDAVSKVAPSVVSIVLTQDLSKIRQSSPFDDFFYGTGQSQGSGTQQVGAGTGFIVTSDGLILTNRHVADREDVDFTVIFNDGTEHSAKVVAIDAFNDLALLKIDGSDLPVVELGDSGSLQLGQTVIAIGNALGEFSNTVTRGVISGIDRTITAGDSSGASETIDSAIQTDAAINPGNSGGPLINLEGQVIGVNTAVSQQGQTIGFSIPINVAKQDVESYRQHGDIVRPYLGVRYTIINKAVQEEESLSVDYGALLVEGPDGQDAVISGSPADKAGLVEGDIILEFNGERVTQKKSLSSFMSDKSVGDQVTLKVLHDDEEKTVTATLEEYERS